MDTNLRIRTRLAAHGGGSVGCGTLSTPCAQASLLRRASLLVVGVLLGGPLSGVGSSPGRAQEPDEPIVNETSVEDALVECVDAGRRANGADGGEASTLGLLVLIDTSGSLKSRDRDNRRVTETKNAIDVLSELVDDVNSTVAPDGTVAEPFKVFVRIDGFGTSYDSGAWTDLEVDGAAALRRRADEFSTKNTDPYTDYRVAVEGAAAAILDLQKSHPESCPLVFWFTDGEYDTDNSKRGNGLTFLDEEEAAEIASDRLCAPGGAVDRLRPVPVVGFGLQNGAQRFSTSLIESIVTGSPYQLDLPAGTTPPAPCGADPAVGSFVTGDGDRLQLELVDRLREISFRSVANGDQLCARNATDCSTTFYVGPQVEGFSLIFERPDRDGFEVVLEAPDCSFVIDDGVVAKQGSLPDRGLSLTSPSRSWR